MTLTVGSLFSGIGGLDLGLERAGMEVRWQSEIDPYASRVLAKHWPHVPNLGDITKIDWSEVERVDLICGGYPCQPFSYAGNRRGTDDPRHLWPHFRNALRVLRPRYALLENVPGHLSLGFGDVQADLADCGYDTEWDCIPAAAVGAPHLRYRIFVVAHARSQARRRFGAGRRFGGAEDASAHVAYANRDGYGGAQDARPVGRVDGSNEVSSRERQRARSQSVDRGTTLADTNARGRQKQWQCFTSEPSRGAGWPEWESWWSVEPDVGRVAHGVPSRVDRLRALGNAVVPQVAQFIGEQLLAVIGADA